MSFQLGKQRFYQISHPEFIEQVLVKQADIFVKTYNPSKPRGLMILLGNGLVTSQGPLWQRQRRMMQPMFSRQQMGHIS